MSVAVADAGPLIHLSEIGCLDLLGLFDTLHVPEAVWLESVQPGRVREGELFALGTIQRHKLVPSSIARFVDEHDLGRLQAGECKALCLFGAYHKGYVTLTQPERHLQALYSVSSLFVTRTIVELAIEKLHLRTG